MIFSHNSIHKAAKNGFIKEVRRFISYGLNVNMRDEIGNTPLHEALCFHYLSDTNKEIVKLLIEQGADVNATNNSGETPLHISAKNFSVDDVIVKLLIEQGSDVNARDNRGYTPLLEASWQGNKDIVKVLMHHGANLNAETTQERTYTADSNYLSGTVIPPGTTALGITLLVPHESSHVEIAEELFNAGAVANEYSWKYGHSLIINELLNEFGPVSNMSEIKEREKNESSRFKEKSFRHFFMLGLSMMLMVLLSFAG